MTSLLDYIEDIRKGSGNPFQSDYRSEVDTLISLAFPSTQKRKKWEHPDYNSMSDEEYYASPHFQGQGRLEESHPVASVVGPLKGANVLRKWALGQAAKPKPTTAPLAITDQTQAPLAEPLRLEGPPDLPMLTYDGTTDPNIDFPDRPYPGWEEDYERHYNAWQDRLRDEQALEWEAAVEEDEAFGRGGVIDPDAAYPAEVNQEYNPNYDGGFPEQGDFDDDVEFGIGGDETPDDYVDDPKIVSGPPLSDEEFYTPPKGFTSSLDKIIAGDTLTKAEKESAVRDIKYRQMSYDNKLFDEVMHDPTRNIYAEMTADEDGNIIASPVPGINDIEAIKKFKDEKPLEFTVRHSADTVGGMPGDKATHLYFGGTNLKRQSKEFREHFFTNGRPAQAFITWNERNGSFNMGEIQSEMSGTNPYGNQVLTKLAQQTWIDFKDSGLSTITIPNGESIFKKYYLSYGKGLWEDESKLLKLKDDDEFDKKAQEFYNQPIIRFEIQKNMQKHIRMAQESGDVEEWLYSDHGQNLLNEHGADYRQIVRDIALDNGLITRLEGMEIIVEGRAEKLKGLRSNYQGKVRHYNKYFKAWQKAGKQHGAELDIKETPEGWDVDLTNPEETFRKVETDGFTMAMLLKKTKKRQVA